MGKNTDLEEFIERLNRMLNGMFLGAEFDQKTALRLEVFIENQINDLISKGVISGNTVFKTEVERSENNIDTLKITYEEINCLKSSSSETETG